jgi:hypothetical protein
VLHDKEAIQHLERQCRHAEKIEGDDDFPMILEKRQPPFTRVTSVPNSTQIPGDSPFRDNEPKLQQFALYLGGSPMRILLR